MRPGFQISPNPFISLDRRLWHMIDDIQYALNRLRVHVRKRGIKMACAGLTPVSDSVGNFQLTVEQDIRQLDQQRIGVNRAFQIATAFFGLVCDKPLTIRYTEYRPRQRGSTAWEGWAINYIVNILGDADRCF